MENDSKLTVSICTIGDRVFKALDVIKGGPAKVCYLIVHQKSDEYKDDVELLVKELIKAKEISLIYQTLDSIGVAYARNAAIEMTNTEFLLFTDDDVVLTTKLFDALNLFSESNYDIATFICLNERDEPRRNYSSVSFAHNKISILSIGTVEVMIRVGIVKQSRCRFPVNMGAGQYLSLSDEPVYLGRCLDFGLKIAFFPVPIVKHSSESSGGVLKTNCSLEARGLAFKEVFGPIYGSFMLMVFIIKSRGKFSRFSGLKGYLNSLYHMYYGFFRYTAK